MQENLCKFLSQEIRSKMTSVRTNAQDGPDLWEADARHSLGQYSTMFFNTAHINL